MSPCTTDNTYKMSSELSLSVATRSNGPAILKHLYFDLSTHITFHCLAFYSDRLCGLLVRVLGYISGGPGSIPGIARKKSSVSGTGFTQPREYN
jgi:hypothetical protein